MTRRCSFGIGWAFGVGMFCLFASPASAAWYWGHSTLSSNPSLCFVGNAVADRPDRVAQILEYISEFERVANIRFNYLGTCPDPIPLGNGFFYGGDLRLYIPGCCPGVAFSDPVPGIGCTIGIVNSSFGREPDFLDSDRPCLYNLKIGDDADTSGVPWRNHTLHEFGHTLGLAHEHQRPDALDPNTCLPLAASCPTPPNPGVDDLLCMTPYDADSVMNYVVANCGIDGNYAHTGLSEWDKLGLHILYPEQNQVAEIMGTKVVRTTEVLSLRSAWELRGANMPAVARNFAWRVGGATYSTGTSLLASFGAGSFPLRVTHEDFLGRLYTRDSTVRVLTPADFNSTIVAPLSVQVVPEPGTPVAALAAVLTLGAITRLSRRRARRRAVSRGTSIRVLPTAPWRRSSPACRSVR